MYYSLLGRVVKFFEQGTSSNFKNRVASTLGYSQGPGSVSDMIDGDDNSDIGEDGEIWEEEGGFLVISADKVSG